MNFETCKEIEIAVANYFGIGTNIIVPNVSWGFLNHEADLLVVSKSGYAWEIEIKVSKSDMVRDQSKRHAHQSNKIRHLWFAIPEKLLPEVSLIPERAGILYIKQSGHVLQHREPQVNITALKLTDEEQFKIVRLGALRIWRLKAKILKLISPTAGVPQV